MSEKIKQIASRIKELRKIAKYSESYVADALKVPAQDYRAFESGSVDIPVSVLYELSRLFKVELTALLTGEEPKLRTYCLVKKGTGSSVDRRKEYKYQDLAFNFAHKKAETFLVTVDPRPEPKKPHFYSHPGQEFNYVLEGSLKVILDNHEVILETGDSLYFNSGHNHAMFARNNKPARFLAIIL